jgi:hypothetical protein
MLFFNHNPELLQFSHYLQPVSLAVVSHEFKGNIIGDQAVYEFIGAGDKNLPPVNHTIHIDQKSVFHLQQFI